MTSIETGRGRGEKGNGLIDVIAIEVKANSLFHLFLCLPTHNLSFTSTTTIHYYPENSAAGHVLNTSVLATLTPVIISVPSTTPSPTPLNPTPSSGFVSESYTISPQESTLFTTDNQSSSWLPPNSSIASPAPVPQAPQFLNNNSAHQLPLPLPQQHQPQQDFVLFDSHRIPPQRPSVSTALAIDGSRRSSHQIQSASPSQQNRSLANLFQSTGHSTNNTTAYSNGFPSAQQQFYASSAPASSPSLQQQRPRPQVPLFSQASGNNAQQTSNNMTMQDMDLYDDFTAFEGGAPAKSYSSAYSSPAVPTIYDPAVNLSSSNSTMGTVSPQDLLRNDPFTPAPNSAAMTNLTSPSTYNESPQYDGLEISPFGNDRELDSAVDANPWFPLFPQEDQMDSKAQDSPLEPEEKLQVSEHLRSSSTVNRLRAGSAASPPSGTHASISGVSSRRRDKPLPPIVVADVNDTVAMKRARNTLAARKSRQRKSQRFDELEERISELEKDRDHWKSIALQRTGGQQ